MSPLEKAAKFPLWIHFLLYAALTLLSLLAITWYTTKTFREFHLEQLKQVLEKRAVLISAQLSESLPAAPTPELNVLCGKLGAITESRITIVTLAGVVVCDSDASPWGMDNHKARPEISEALVGSVSSSIRYSNTLGTELLYVAHPFVNASDELQGVIRVALPLTAITDHLRAIWFKLGAVALLITALIALTSIVLYQRIRKPLTEMRKRAMQFARGRFDKQLPRYGLREVDELAVAMNRMGQQLKHLEQVRSDFVANVSHELKTPITSIKGFVETLLDGAMEDEKDARRFLEIIAKQSERLTSITVDLLTLAKLESKGADSLLELQNEPLDELLDSVVEACRSSAQQKSISLTVNCSSEMQVQADRSLLEQALINLVNNAINYSDEHSEVAIRADVDDAKVRIEVSDQGPGIPEEHLTRLFERFYRVDRARSRTLGGTGLGLAIVKHVAQVHGGQVGVQSAVGKGSKFTISLPLSA